MRRRVRRQREKEEAKKREEAQFVEASLRLRALQNQLALIQIKRDNRQASGS